MAMVAKGKLANGAIATINARTSKRMLPPTWSNTSMPGITQLQMRRIVALQACNLQIFIVASRGYQPYYTYAKQFVQELSKLHIQYQLDIENGSHAWKVWQIQMYHTLLWLHWGS